MLIGVRKINYFCTYFSTTPTFILWIFCKQNGLISGLLLTAICDHLHSSKTIFKLKKGSTFILIILLMFQAQGDIQSLFH